MPNPGRLASTYISSQVTPNVANLQKSVTNQKMCYHATNLITNLDLVAKFRYLFTKTTPV